MIIRELLARKNVVEIISISPSGTLLETAEILRDRNIGALLITDKQGRLVGLVSERDVARAVAIFGNDVADQPVASIMTRNVVTCAPDDNIIETMALMNEKRIRHIPVVEDGMPRAMVSLREFDHAYKQLQAQSRTDELTGLANRRFFMETLEKEMSRHDRFGTPLSAALIDLDHFKHVNDTFGHEAGDQVLCALAKLLIKELRTFDGIGRLGGEEFAVLFPNTSGEDAERACQRLLKKIRELEVPTDEGTIRFTASFGLASADQSTPTGKKLLKAADRLLYEAKNGGRNRIVTQSASQSASTETERPDVVAQRTARALREYEGSPFRSDVRGLPQ